MSHLNIPESLTPYGRERIRRETLEAVIRPIVRCLPDPLIEAEHGFYVMVPTAALSKLQEAMRD